MPGPILVVLAAGIGSRYGGLKQMEPVGPHGESIIDYSVYDALRAGFGRVVLVIRKEMERPFRDRIGRNVERRCETVYVFQEMEDLPPGVALPPARQKPWGTAHAVLSCRFAVDVPFAVINADDFYGRTSYQALHAFLGATPAFGSLPCYAMVGYSIEKTLSEHGTVSRGICRVTADGYLEELHERRRIEPSDGGARYTEDGECWVFIPAGTAVSMNIWGFGPGVFLSLEARFSSFFQENRDRLESAEFLLPEVIGDLVRERKARVQVLPTPERWLGVTYRQDRPRVSEAIRELIDRGVYPASLWS